nr:reverse transcriptase domain-containing protein [Tanacetum cinerariifolium]
MSRYVIVVRYNDDRHNKGSSSTPIYSPRSSTPPCYSPGASTPLTYSLGTSRNEECSNCKHLLDKITVLEETVDMYMHPEQHTVNSAALFHEDSMEYKMKNVFGLRWNYRELKGIMKLRLFRTRVDPNLLNDFNMATNGNDDDGPPPNRGGDDANKHLDKFLHVTQSIKVNRRPDESLFEAWECYKLSIDHYPNHNMLPVTQIDTFYNGLTLRHCDTINAAAGGTFMKRRSFLKTGGVLIDVYEGELTLRIGNKAVTFNLDQTLRYSSNYDAESINQIDVIDVAYSDFLLEETDAFLATDDEPISPEIDDSYYDSEGDILLLEEFLNDDPSSPPLPPQEFKDVEPKNENSSIDEPPVVELKDLPPHLEYAF